MTQWAEIRHQHQVDGIPKKELARRFKLDVKTVRRALQQATPPKRRKARRPSRMDRFRGRIEELLRNDPDLTNKRVGVLLLQQGCDVRERQRNGYIARCGASCSPRRCSCTARTCQARPWRATSDSRSPRSRAR